MAVDRPSAKTARDFSIGDLIRNDEFPGVFLIVGEYVVEDRCVDNWVVLCPDEQLGHVEKCDLDWEKVS